MNVSLKIMSGPLAGRSYPLKPGMILGRAETDITLNDSKISGRHAKIEINKTGDLVITDLGSTNGLRVKGKRFNTVVLTPGVTIKIGNTECLVEQYQEGELSAAQPATVEPSPETWSEFFTDLATEFATQAQNKVVALLPFHDLLKLSVIRGLQSGQEWVLGYGPRSIGFESTDIVLMGPGIPEIAFTVAPSGPDVLFETNHSDVVLLNEQRVKAEKLRSGDVIQILDTLIEVSFIQDDASI